MKDASPEARMREVGGTTIPPRQKKGGNAGAQRPNGSAHTEPYADIISTKLPVIPISQIPPRQWAYGHFLLFGSAAVIGGVDGGGKGSIAVVMALAMITGKPLFGEKVWKNGPVAIITYEDDQTEWHRRIAAACIHYELDYEMVVDNVHFICRPDDARITFGRHSRNGIEFPDSDAVIAQLVLINPVLLIVDPFNHAHDLEDGNSNTPIARVAGEVSRIAKVVKCAVLVLHHLRKGATGQADDLMGATSLRATFRSCRILARMPPDVADKMKITDAWRYSRILGSKENFAPPPERGTWYRLESVELGNPSEDYPAGDNLGAAATWQARPMFQGMDANTLAAVFHKLRDTIHGPNKNAKNTPWAGRALMEIGGRSENEAGKIVTVWIETGVLIRDDHYHGPSKNKVQKVVVVDAKVSEILAEMRMTDAVPE